MASSRIHATLGIVVVAVVLIAAAVALALRAGLASAPAGEFVVRGRVTGTEGQPVSGIKVWLNAWPTAAVLRELTGQHQPVPVTVLGSAITSPTGSYVLRITPSAALAADATNGVVTFAVMTGDSAGGDALKFSRRLGPAGTMSPAVSGGIETADLRLKP
jgi:hypothetical protein